MSCAVSCLGRFTLLLVALFLSVELVRGGPQLRKRDADFWSVRTHLDEDQSDNRPTFDGREKYFREAKFHHHYDGRFAARELHEAERMFALRLLVKTYLRAMQDIGAETWIMHGTLLGWWWNRRIMPWDTDVDVQVTQRSIEYLANYYNMTVHRFRVPKAAKVKPLFEPSGVSPLDAARAGKLAGESGRSDVVRKPQMVTGEGVMDREEKEERARHRRYLLEINPFYKNGSIDDRWNVIDGRWIDMETGVFIDITTLRYNPISPRTMYCKDMHVYLTEDIFPLRDSEFEGEPVKVPFAYSQLIQEEYGPHSLTWTQIMAHKFDDESKQWILNANWLERETYRMENRGRTKHKTEQQQASMTKPKFRPKRPSRLFEYD